VGKNIAASIVGIIVAVGLVWLVEKLGHAVYPPPTDLDFANPDAMRTYMKTIPVGALLFVGAAWFIGTLGGTFVACKIRRTKPMMFAVVVGGLMLLATAANLIMIPHPIWFSILGVAGVVVGAWLGMTLGMESASEPE
jgi:hypothetical protein